MSKLNHHLTWTLGIDKSLIRTVIWWDAFFRVLLLSTDSQFFCRHDVLLSFTADLLLLTKKNSSKLMVQPLRDISSHGLGSGSRILPGRAWGSGRRGVWGYMAPGRSLGLVCWDSVHLAGELVAVCLPTRHWSCFVGGPFIPESFLCLFWPERICSPLWPCGLGVLRMCQ